MQRTLARLGQRCFASAGRFQRLCHGGLFAAPSGFVFSGSAQGAGQQTFKEQIPKYYVLMIRNTCANANTSPGFEFFSDSEPRGQKRSALLHIFLSKFTQTHAPFCWWIFIWARTHWA
jgi:hypothetical protein